MQSEHSIHKTNRSLVHSHFHTPRFTSAGVQVFDCYWPIKLSKEAACIMRFDFWDKGEAASKDFTYLSQISKENRQVQLYVCAVNDITSFQGVQRQLTEDKVRAAVHKGLML